MWGSAWVPRGRGEAVVPGADHGVFSAPRVPAAALSTQTSSRGTRTTARGRTPPFPDEEKWNLEAPLVSSLVSRKLPNEPALSDTKGVLKNPLFGRPEQGKGGKYFGLHTGEASVVV